MKVATLLRGYRGSRQADVQALRDLLLRISRLVDDIPEILEMDLNPVMAREAGRGAVALDARIRVIRASGNHMGLHGLACTSSRRRWRPSLPLRGI